MTIFYGGRIYGLKYSDKNKKTNSYEITYERKPDISIPIDKLTIKKILMDASKIESNNRLFEVYVFYLQTNTTDTINKKGHIWKQIDIKELESMYKHS
jgi:hypothetical protein